MGDGNNRGALTPIARACILRESLTFFDVAAPPLLKKLPALVLLPGFVINFFTLFLRDLSLAGRALENGFIPGRHS
jgi:hypothetical protein